MGRNALDSGCEEPGDVLEIGRDYGFVFLSASLHGGIYCRDREKFRQNLRYQSWSEFGIIFTVERHQELGLKAHANRASERKPRWIGKAGCAPSRR